MAKPNILCVPSSGLWAALPYLTGAIRTRGLPDLSYTTVRFHARAEKEIDPGYKQLIPYVVLARPDGRVLLYRRKNKNTGGEARLDEKLSIGIGGHVEPTDAMTALRLDREAPTLRLAPDQISAVLRACALREILEETDAKPDSIIRLDLAGFVNEDETSVGQVHFGVVFVATMDDIYKTRPESGCEDLGWLPIDMLNESSQHFVKLELWSRYIVPLLRHRFSRSTHLNSYVSHSMFDPPVCAGCERASHTVALTVSVGNIFAHGGHNGLCPSCLFKTGRQDPAPIGSLRDPSGVSIGPWPSHYQLVSEQRQSEEEQARRQEEMDQASFATRTQEKEKED